MPEPEGHHSTRWLTAATIDADALGLTAGDLVKGLADARIEARPVWKPMHLQPLFEGCGYWSHEPGRSISDELFAHGICLPSGSNMTPEEQRRVIDRVIEVVEAARPRRAAPVPASKVG